MVKLAKTFSCMVKVSGYMVVDSSMAGNICGMLIFVIC
jgi:hypothetical protein